MQYAISHNISPAPYNTALSLHDPLPDVCTALSIMCGNGIQCNQQRNIPLCCGQDFLGNGVRSCISVNYSFLNYQFVVAFFA